MLKCHFNKVAKQLYCNHTWALVLLSKFAAFSQSTFSEEHPCPWTATSERNLNLKCLRYFSLVFYTFVAMIYVA